MSGITPYLEGAFVEEGNVELEHNIIEAEVKNFSQSFVPQTPVRYNTQKYSRVEAKFDGLANCRNEQDMYHTLVR